MEERGIFDKVKEIIADVANLDPDEIGDEALFIEELSLDSLSLLEIGVDVDYHFKLGVTDEVLKELRSVRDTVVLVQKCHAEKVAKSEVA